MTLNLSSFFDHVTFVSFQTRSHWPSLEPVIEARKIVVEGCKIFYLAM